MSEKYNGISLFTGAGGMDIGFQKAGINIEWANEIDKDASLTYKVNYPNTNMQVGDIREFLTDLKEYKGTDVVFGGPPCQGFSVAGKMDPNDERSKLVWTFLDVVKMLKPKAFVLENVKALGTLEKWKLVREKIYRLSEEMGYSCNTLVLNSADFGVPQKRERVFFIGFLNKTVSSESIEDLLSKYRKPSETVREAIQHLGPAGTEKNPLTSTAKITFAKNPIMRKSPFAGMLFNGMGRPLNLDETSTTLPASMGGNKTPIIDEEHLHGQATENWVVGYHKGLQDGTITPEYKLAPDRLRRLTIKEAALIQTFPEGYKFEGSRSSIYKQIGNAVPIVLAETVANIVIDVLENSVISTSNQGQLTIDDICNFQEKTYINS